MQPSNPTTGYQQSLAHYCRTGEYTHIRGVHTDHVQHYRRLVYNVVDDSLQSAYPLTYHLLEEEEWNNLVQRFFSEHPCQSPQLWYMPKELYDYMIAATHPLLTRYPFLLELLWFEWLEVALYMMEDKTTEYRHQGDLQQDKLVLNPEHHLEHFAFPVHLKQAATIIAEDQSHYFLALHRHPESGEVQFTDLSPAFVSMLESLAEGPATMNELLAHACTTLGIPESEAIRQATQAFLAHALRTQLILGFA
ncbi:hypothetical protein GA0116948_11727 [Chitinophaga costaii]|uniref:Uncharacterized protein n=1 Tax=Chitinophaga costaii TaxID=1335309 RepID=A0A1C4FV19_9BACT|nr:putative DNA-binding domain-containing protein [Chitinophaga costaii]PUZ27218.1 DUF2063 domain-containing protein [Chitinophaga costaii]SCC59493.1 hypothetical protein GA0116948_11727 [Chitinophaga costaii]